MKFTRHIPARQETFVATWVQQAFMIMSQRHRDIRSGSRNKMDSCFKCRRKFEDGETLALACFEKIGNRTLCQSCADELLAQKE